MHGHLNVKYNIFIAFNNFYGIEPMYTTHHLKSLTRNNSMLSYLRNEYMSITKL